MFASSQILIKIGSASECLSSCPRDTAESEGSRPWSGFPTEGQTGVFLPQRKNNRPHVHKGNEFTVHPNEKERLTDLVCFSRCLTFLINNCKAKWNLFIAHDKIVEMKRSSGTDEDN